MKNRHLALSLMVCALGATAYGGTMTIDGDDCVDTYVDTTTPNKNYEGAEKTLAQI